MDGFLYNVALPLCEPGVQQHLAERKHRIEEAKVGKTSASLMRIGNTGRSTLMSAAAVTCYKFCVDAGMSLFTIVSTFGRFLKYFLLCQEKIPRNKQKNS